MAEGLGPGGLGHELRESLTQIWVGTQGDQTPSLGVRQCSSLPPTQGGAIPGTGWQMEALVEKEVIRLTDSQGDPLSRSVPG